MMFSLFEIGITVPSFVCFSALLLNHIDLVSPTAYPHIPFVQRKRDGEQLRAAVRPDDDRVSVGEEEILIIDVVAELLL